MAKTTQTINKKKYIRFTLILLIAAVVIYGVLFFVVDQRAKSAEKKEFLDNKAQIEEIAKKIVRAYPPSEEKHEESCRYQSAKFDRGDLYCNVSVQLTYKSITLEKANESSQSSATLAGTILRPSQSYAVRQSNFISTDQQNTPQGRIGEILNAKGCTISFVYDGGKESPKELLGTLSCNRTAKGEYFSVKK